MKAIVKKARKRTKENGKPPSPTKLPRAQQSLEPTPASAWGSALRQYNAPSLSGNRWQQEKIADPATYVNNYDPKFDWDQVILDDWCFSYNGSRPLQLSGKVFNNGEGYDEGDSLEYTSQVVPTKTIKMPKVPGWRHDSAVALLHDWQVGSIVFGVF
ncbi:hypothetical protein AB1Y20_020309 [Prymnesium parvum]|uniref:Uncharacterized protein n=1 Tax=Prymnesium parvum TaxID=97485 RepID=A0AB34JX85_PRYPA